MDPLQVGVALAVTGIGGTLLGLGVIALLIGLLKRMFPLREAEGQAAAGPEGPAPS